MVKYVVPIAVYKISNVFLPLSFFVYVKSLLLYELKISIYWVSMLQNFQKSFDCFFNFTKHILKWCCIQYQIKKVIFINNPFLYFKMFNSWVAWMTCNVNYLIKAPARVQWIKEDQFHSIPNAHTRIKIRWNQVLS